MVNTRLQHTCSCKALSRPQVVPSLQQHCYKRTHMTRSEVNMRLRVARLMPRYMLRTPSPVHQYAKQSRGFGWNCNGPADVSVIVHGPAPVLVTHQSGQYASRAFTFARTDSELSLSPSALDGH